MRSHASERKPEPVSTSELWVGILSTGEEEVEVAKSEAPVHTGVWCKREMPASR